MTIASLKFSDKSPACPLLERTWEAGTTLSDLASRRVTSTASSPDTPLDNTFLVWPAPMPSQDQNQPAPKSIASSKVTPRHSTPRLSSLQVTGCLHTPMTSFPVG